MNSETRLIHAAARPVHLIRRAFHLHLSRRPAPAFRRGTGIYLATAMAGPCVGAVVAVAFQQ